MEAGGVPYTYVGVPEADSGQRFVSEKELIEMLNKNPKLREAVDRVERHDFNGKPCAIKQLLIKQAVNDYATALKVRSSKMVIDYHKRKLEGKIK